MMITNSLVRLFFAVVLLAAFTSSTVESQSVNSQQDDLDRWNNKLEIICRLNWPNKVFNPEHAGGVKAQEYQALLKRLTNQYLKYSCGSTTLSAKLLEVKKQEGDFWIQIVGDEGLQKISSVNISSAKRNSSEAFLIDGVDAQKLFRSIDSFVADANRLYSKATKEASEMNRQDASSKDSENDPIENAEPGSATWPSKYYDQVKRFPKEFTGKKLSGAEVIMIWRELLKIGFM